MTGLRLPLTNYYHQSINQSINGPIWLINRVESDIFKYQVSFIQSSGDWLITQCKQSPHKNKSGVTTRRRNINPCSCLTHFSKNVLLTPFVFEQTTDIKHYLENIDYEILSAQKPGRMNATFSNVTLENRMFRKSSTSNAQSIKSDSWTVWKRNNPHRQREQVELKRALH